ncbi:AAA family ATPase [Chloroflexota bacterium]
MPIKKQAGPNKSTVIAISGKGGSGKTVTSAIIIKLLRPRISKILAIDADPATTLPPALGMEVRGTIADIREKMVAGPGRAPSTDMPVDMVLDYRIKSILAEAPGLSLLAIGHPEGPGCYCLVNDILRHAVEKFSSRYELTLIDCEAGMEHLSRRTTRSVDTMLIVTDPTHRGMNTARLIRSLADNLEIGFSRMGLILNRATEDLAGGFEETAAGIGLELVGTVPEDGNVTRYDREGIPIVDLPDDSPAVLAIRGILQKLRLIT